MKRLGLVWLIFGLCVALAAAAMARVGATAIGLERAEARAPPGCARRERATGFGVWTQRSHRSWRRKVPRPYFAFSASTRPSGPSRICSPRFKRAMC